MSDFEHLQWGAEALWKQLEPLLPGLSVEVVARADSTNSRLIARARDAAGQPDAPISVPAELQNRSEVVGSAYRPLGRRSDDTMPYLLVAEHQTEGRGRMGRDWRALPGASLTFSLALPMAPRQWSGMSLAVGLAIAQALDPDGSANAPRIGLKWPNDLWLCDTAAALCPGRKLGGILIETITVGDSRMCVVGIGLNVCPFPSPTLNEGLSQGIACLQEIEPDITPPLVLARVAEPLVRALHDFERRGFAPLAAAYARRDVLRGQAVTTTHSEVEGGVAEGVDDDGALRVRSGQLHRLVSGEVSVRV
ncbi:MAG: biotin--[acetyl-CoA-carboxylase] ligase [Rubrivivax sp.]